MYHIHAQVYCLNVRSIRSPPFLFLLSSGFSRSGSDPLDSPFSKNENPFHGAKTSDDDEINHESILVIVQLLLVFALKMTTTTIALPAP